MDTQKLLEESIFIVTKYYENDISHFLNSMRDDVLWLGPSDSQKIQSKKLLVDTFSKEKHSLTFATMNMKAECIYQTKTHCEILLTYLVDTFYPDDNIIRCNQRVHFSWQNTEIIDADGNKTYEPLIRVCNISNSIPYDSRDTIYPNNFTTLSIAKELMVNYSNEKKIKFNGKGNTLFYLAESSIMYITNDDHYATIHTANNSFECANSLSELEHQMPEYFVRCHVSSMINTKFVKSIKRFCVTLENGVELNIPARKYTEIRDAIEQQILKNKARP